MTVTQEERHNRAHPCPICGGWDGMTRGKDKRCAGFASSDGKWAFCTRVAEGAHHEATGAALQTWAHLLRDEPLESAAGSFTVNGGAVPSRPPVDPSRELRRIERELKAVESLSESARSANEYERDRDEYDRLWAELEALKKAPADAAQPKEPIKWVEPSRLMAKLPAIDWICEGLRLAPGVVSCFSGYGYSGKTALGQLLLLSVATGRSFLKLYDCKQGPVGHLDYEQGFRLSVERLQRLCNGIPIPLTEGLSHVKYCPFPEVYLDDQKGKDAICKAVDGLKLVLIDSSRAAMPGVDENDSKSRVHVDSLSRISERTGTAFLLVCHDGKSGDGNAPRAKKERTRGSSAMFDAMQTMWGFEMKDGEDFGRADLRKDRLTGSKASFGYRFEDSPATLGESPSWLRIQHLSPEQMKGSGKPGLFRLHVLHVLMAHPGLSSVELVCMHMPDGFRHASSVRATIRDLEKEKRVNFDRERGYFAT